MDLVLIDKRSCLFTGFFFLCSFVCFFGLFFFLGEGRLPGYHWKIVLTRFLGSMEQIRSVSLLICCYFLRGEMVLILRERSRTQFAVSGPSPPVTSLSVLSTQGVVLQHLGMIHVRAVGFCPYICCVFLPLPSCRHTAALSYGELVQGDNWWKAGQKIMDDDFICWCHCQKLLLFFFLFKLRSTFQGSLY